MYFFVTHSILNRRESSFREFNKFNDEFDHLIKATHNLSMLPIANKEQLNNLIVFLQEDPLLRQLEEISSEIPDTGSCNLIIYKRNKPQLFINDVQEITNINGNCKIISPIGQYTAVPELVDIFQTH